MKRLFASACAAAALAAPALAQDAAMPGGQVDENDLIPMELVSEDELRGANVYFADGSSAGMVRGWDTEDGDITSLLVFDIMPEDSIVSRYRITGEDIAGYDDDQRTIVLGLNADDLDY